MEEKHPRPMTPLDTICTPSYLYTLKLLLPYVPSGAQRVLAVLIKFQEFQNVMQNFRHFSSGSPGNILEDMKPYLSREEQESFEQLENMMNIINMMEMMQSAGPDSGADMTSSIYSFLDPLMKGEFNEQRMDQSSGDEEHGPDETGTD